MKEGNSAQRSLDSKRDAPNLIRRCASMSVKCEVHCESKQQETQVSGVKCCGSIVMKLAISVSLSLSLLRCQIIM